MTAPETRCQPMDPNTRGGRMSENIRRPGEVSKPPPGLAATPTLEGALAVDQDSESPAGGVDEGASDLGDRRLLIRLNSHVKMSRGKAAAQAVHAALTLLGVHPGCPVIVLGGKPRDIEVMPFQIRDSGLTELAPWTLTAGAEWTTGERADRNDDRPTGELTSESLWGVRYRTGKVFLCGTEQDARDEADEANAGLVTPPFAEVIRLEVHKIGGNR